MRLMWGARQQTHSTTRPNQGLLSHLSSRVQVGQRQRSLLAPRQRRGRAGRTRGPGPTVEWRTPGTTLPDLSRDARPSRVNIVYNASGL